MNGQDVKNGVLRYWQVITVMLGLAVTWGTLTTDMRHVQTALAQTRAEAKELDDSQNEIDRAVVSLKATQDSIKEDVREIKQEQKEQSQKLDKILEELRKQ